MQIEMAGERTLLYGSLSMQKVVDRITKVAKNPRPVLITGETGTGKELIARLVHQKRDPQAPFVPVNCATVQAALWEDEFFGHVKGAFTDAHLHRPGRVLEAGSGVLYLDEIGETSLENQAKLLRLLQEREFQPVGGEKQFTAKCRFVFATNRDLEQMVQEGGFRKDLLYRLNGIEIRLPPLRERIEDIFLLAEYLLEQLAVELGKPMLKLSPDALSALTTYHWPGNIRELENVLFRAASVADTDTLTLQDVSLKLDNEQMQEAILDDPSMEVQGTLAEILDYHTKITIIRTLRKTNGNKARAAKLLSISRTRLHYRIRDLNILMEELK